MMDWVDSMMGTQIILLQVDETLEKLGVTDEEIDRARALVPARLHAFLRLWIGLYPQIVWASVQKLKTTDGEASIKGLRALESKFHSLAACAFLVDPSAVSGNNIEALMQELDPLLRQAFPADNTVH